MDIGVADESLNGIPIEESSSEAEQEEDEEMNGKFWLDNTSMSFCL